MKNKLTNLQRKNSGFTLLELVVVVGIMGLMSTMAMDLYTDKSNQIRYDLTKKRVEEIRYAIIGDDSRTLNGQPTISGYIADTGKVPTKIIQLILKAYCKDDPWLTTEPECDAAMANWTDQADINWKGPYLKAYSSVKYTRKIDGVDISKNIPAYRDGWGRSINNHQVLSTIPADALIQKNNQIKDMKNFGWEFAYDSGTSEITLQSYGLNRITNSTSTDPTIAFFEKNYPANRVSLISSNEYSSGSNPLVITITNSANSPVATCLSWKKGASTDEVIVNIAHDADSNTYMGTTSIDIATLNMGFISFTLAKDANSDGDCLDVGDDPLALSKTRGVIHHSIDSTFSATFN